MARLWSWVEPDGYWVFTRIRRACNHFNGSGRSTACAVFPGHLTSVSAVLLNWKNVLITCLGERVF